MREDFTVMKDVAQFTRHTPQQRVIRSTKYVHSLQSNQNATRELGKLGIRFSEEVSDIKNGRMLPVTRIMQNESALRYKPESADWSRMLNNSHFDDPKELHIWHVFFPKRLQDPVRKFVQELINAGRNVGMNISPPEFVAMDRDGGDAYVDNIKKQVTASSSSSEMASRLVMCVLPDDRKDRYDAIKKLTCCERPVPSQNVIAKTIKRENILKSVAVKVVMQINCKLQGRLWNAEIPIKNKGVLMVVGIDTFQDEKMSEGRSRKVTGAFVASYNPQATAYWSRHIKEVQDLSSLASALGKTMSLALKNFRFHNGKLPDRIMVYRDGVGDGQLENIRQAEVEQYLKAFEQLGDDYMPKLTVTVVTKRIPQRFFLRRGPKEYVNPPPGTVVDTTVTKHDSAMYDYFIVSQSTNQGTVSPTHYNIIYDTSNWNMDRHQMLAYKLCHLYYNWAGTIRVPAPCQYAHKLAFMVTQNLHQQPKDDLADRLWYL